MSKPYRYQIVRYTKGWRDPLPFKRVTRSSRWGNPFPLSADKTNRDEVISRFAEEILPNLDLAPLRGFNLGCECELHERCHADVLLVEANK